MAMNGDDDVHRHHRSVAIPYVLHAVRSANTATAELLVELRD